MKKHITRWSAVVLTISLLCLTFCSCSLSGQSFDDPARHEIAAGHAVVQFLDVGQADCSLIQLPDGRNILIDAGNEEDGPYLVQYLNRLGVEKLDFVVGTHPHEDHIGGLDDVIVNFTVGEIVLPKIDPTDVSGTVCYENVLLAADGLEKSIIQGKRGVQLIAESDIGLLCLSPGKEDYGGLNDYSVVLLFTYGDTKILFTGDAEEEAESDMLSAGVPLKADILKVGHHGSNTASGKKFLDAVSPEYAVISCGKGNSYGHPHSETLSRLSKTKATVMRTDYVGSVVFYLDKTKIINFITSTDIKLDGN